MIQKHAIPILEFDDNPQAGSRGAGLALAKEVCLCIFR